MTFSKLGKTGILASRIVLGTWQFDGTTWDGIDDAESIKTVHAALDAGINTLDTAEAYGRSEEVVGKAVQDRRQDVHLISKLNREPECVRRTVEQSLRRLRTDYIDVYLAHYPPKTRPWHSVLEELDRLREAGMIRAIGVSNFTRQQMEESLKSVRFDVCEPPYSILWRQIDQDGTLEFCRKNEIGVITYSSMAQGLLAGAFLNRQVPEDIHAKNKLFSPGTFEASNSVAGRLKQISDKYGRSMAQVALNWVIATEGVTAAIAGAERPWQTQDAVGAVDWEMEPSDYAELSDIGMQVSATLDFSTNMWSVDPRV